MQHSMRVGQGRGLDMECCGIHLQVQVAPTLARAGVAGRRLRPGMLLAMCVAALGLGLACGVLVSRV
jgi:hypothetical protein